MGVGTTALREIPPTWAFRPRCTAILPLLTSSISPAEPHSRSQNQRANYSYSLGTTPSTFRGGPRPSSSQQAPAPPESPRPSAPSDAWSTTVDDRAIIAQLAPPGEPSASCYLRRAFVAQPYRIIGDVWIAVNGASCHMANNANIYDVRPRIEYVGIKDVIFHG